MPARLRRRPLRSALAFACVLGTSVAVAQLAGVSGVDDPAAGRTLRFADTGTRWLVQLPADAGGSSTGTLNRAADRFGGGKAGDELPGGWHEVRLDAPADADQVERTFAAAGVTEVEPVVARVPYELEPDAVSDPPPTTSLRSAPASAPELGRQWALGQANDQDIDGIEAWQRGTGTGRLVAVIDTGVDSTHPDLAGRVLAGRDFSGAQTGATTDVVGHGTAVASLIAAGGIGMAGVAPDARILPLKVFRDSATGFSMSGYLAAIRYAADAGADVINISLGCGGSTSCYSQAELDALAYAADKGVLVVAAAGNGDASGRGIDNDDARTPDYPSGYELPNVLSVTSSNRLGAWSSWANFGDRTVDLAAPGDDVLAARPGGAYASVTGTSFAAPIVSGVGALAAAAAPDAAPDDLRAHLMATTVANASFAGRTVTGGVVNADAALAAPIARTSPTSAGASAAPTVVAPRDRARVAGPPVLSWRLPSGWSSLRLVLRGPGGTYTIPLRAGSRAASHPARAWRSGTYRWRLVARTAGGGTVTTGERTYRVAPRLDAWLRSGSLADGGRTVRLRVGYAASEPSASTTITVLRGSAVVARAVTTTRREHVRGAGSPPRAWFRHNARTTRVLRVGERITVVVRVRAGGASTTRRFTARVA